MKLSELKALVAQMEQRANPDNPNPEVSFWLTLEVEQSVKASPEGRSVYIDVVPQSLDAAGGVVRNKTFIEGNYSWPLELVK